MERLISLGQAHNIERLKSWVTEASGGALAARYDGDTPGIALARSDGHPLDIDGRLFIERIYPMTVGSVPRLDNRHRRFRDLVAGWVSDCASKHMPQADMWPIMEALSEFRGYSPRRWTVTLTETRHLTVEVRATSRRQAETKALDSVAAAATWQSALRVHATPLARSRAAMTGPSGDGAAVSEFEALGRSAYKTGAIRAPPLDPAVQERLEGVAVGASKQMLSAAAGLDAANLADQVKSSPTTNPPVADTP